MARRRLNKKLIVQLCIAGALLLAVGLAGAYYQFVYSKNPIPHVQAGDKAMEAGQYETAVEEYAEAIRLKDNDQMVWIKLGDAHNYMAADDVQNLLKARGVWEAVITENPKFLLAHQRVLKWFQDYAEASGGAGRARMLNYAADTARKILLIAPNDAAAQFVIPQTVIDAWMAGQPTDPDKIADTITELRKLAVEQPENYEIPFTISRALANQGFEAVRNGDRNQATMLFDEATKTMSDAVVARPDDPNLLLRQAQMIVGIGPRMEQEVDRNDAKVREKGKQLSQEAGSIVERALTLMKPEDSDFVPAAQYAALMKQRVDDAAGAERILRDAMAKRPDEMGVRLQLAELVRGTGDATKLPEAIKLITDAPAVGPVKPGIAGQVARETQIRGAAMLADMKLDQYAQIKEKEPAAAAALLKEADDSITKLSSRDPDSPRVLRIKGKLELFRGNGVEAVQTLNRALAQAPDTSDRTHYEIKYLLARAYQLTGQTGESEKYMRDIADRLDYLPAQIELMKLLLRKGDNEGAAKMLQTLQSKAPSSPEVISLGLAYEDQVNRDRDPKKFKELYATLKETTASERFYKAQIGDAAQLYPEAVALLESVYKEKPDDRGAVALLAKVYDKNGQKEKAIAVLDDFIARHPDTPGLRVIRETIRGVPQQQLDATRIEEIQNVKDPIDRNVYLHEFYRRRADEPGMATAMAELIKLAPDDRRVIDVRFQTALVKRDWVTADSLLEVISKNNYDNSDGKLGRARRALAEAQAETDPEKRKTLDQNAIDRAGDLVQARGDFAESWMALAQAQVSANKLENAVEAYNQALTRQSTNQAALEGLIRSTYLLRRKDDCRRYIDQARKVYPKAQLFIEYEVSWEAQFGEAIKIIPIREQNLKDNPESALAYGNLAAAWQTAAIKEPDPAKQKEMRLKSYDLFKQGVDKFPNDPNLVAAFGEVAQLVDKWKEGEAAWLKLAALPEWKDKPELAARVANYYRRGGKITEGVAYLQEFIKRTDVPPLHVALADLYFADKKVDEAMKELELAGNYDPAIKRRTEVLMQMGKMDDAAAVAKAAVDAQPDNPGLLCRLAFIQIAQRNLPEAQANLSKVLAVNPRDPEALFYMGLIEAQGNNIDRAMSYLTTVLEVAPENPEALKLRADLYRRRNNIDAATADMEAVIRKIPDDKDTRIQLIELYINEKPPKLVDAERLCRDAGAVPALARDFEILHAAARVYYAKGDYKQALAGVVKAIEVAPDNLPLQDTYFRTLGALKDFSGVVNSSTALLEKNKEPWIYATRAAAYAKLKQTDKAMADFEAGYNLASERGDGLGQQTIVRGMQAELDLKQAIDFLKPRVGDDANRKILLAQLQAQAGDYTSAVKAVEDLYGTRDKMTPSQRSAFLKFMGSILLQPPRNITRARQVYDEYLQMVPNDFEVLNNVGYALLLPESGAKPQEALDYTERAYKAMVQLNTIDPFVEDTHGQALMETGQLQQAITTLRDAVSRKEFPDGFVNLADALQRNGDFQEATAALDRAQQIMDDLIKRTQPVNPELNDKINKLRAKIANSGQEPPKAPGN